MILHAQNLTKVEHKMEIDVGIFSNVYFLQAADKCIFELCCIRSGNYFGKCIHAQYVLVKVI